MVNTCAFVEEARQESIDTILGLSDTRLEPAPSWSSPVAWPSATAPSWPSRCPRSTGSSASAGRSSSEQADQAEQSAAEWVACDDRRLAAVRSRGARLRPAQHAPPRADRAVGLREGRRGLRPRLRVLCHPVVPRASSAHVTVPTLVDRGPIAGRRWRARDRARRPGPGQLRPRPGRGLQGDRRRSSTRWPPSSTGSGCSTCTRPSSPTPLIDAICRTGVPYFDLSLQHVSRPARPAHAPLGRRRPLPRTHRSHPRRSSPTPRSGRNFIVGYPGETEADHDALLAFVEEAQLDWCGFFSYSEGGRHLRGRSRRRGARDARPASVCSSFAACRTTSPPPAATSSSAAPSRCWSTNPASAARIARRPRSTASSPCPTDLEVGSILDVVVDRGRGPRGPRRTCGRRRQGATRPAPPARPMRCSA